MLQGDFLRYCFDVVYIPKSGGNGFPGKHFNIIDPLKNDNNLGRSVSEGMVYLVMSIYTCAQKTHTTKLMIILNFSKL